MIHQVDIYVNGRERPELEPFIVRLFKRGEQRQPYVQDLLRSGERKPLPPVPNDYQSVNRGSVFSSYDPYIGYAGFDPDLYYRGYEFPFWIDHLYYRDFKLFGPDHVINADQETEDPITVHGEFAHQQAERSALNPDGQFLGLHTRRDLPQAFDGREYGILYIDLEPFGEPIRSVRVDLTLANDYHIEVAEIDQAGTDLNPPGVNYKGRYRYATFFRPVARAKGNPQGRRLEAAPNRGGHAHGLEPVQRPCPRGSQRLPDPRRIRPQQQLLPVRQRSARPARTPGRPRHKRDQPGATAGKAEHHWRPRLLYGRGAPSPPLGLRGGVLFHGAPVQHGTAHLCRAR